MPFRTINEYFDIRSGEQIEKWERVKHKYDKLKVHKTTKYDTRTGWHTITRIIECEPRRQQSMFEI